MKNKRLPLEIASEIVKVVACDIGGRTAPLMCRPEYIQDAVEMICQMSRAVIVSGFYIGSAQEPETDGPGGAVILARALHEEGRRAEIWTDSLCRDAMAICARAAGFPEDHIFIHDTASFSSDGDSPDGIIFIERPGKASDGKYYNFRKDDITKWIAPLDDYINYARSMSIPTIGIGDGGNEAGMGVFKDALSEKLPVYSQCLSVVSADVAIPVDVSNWGAYALVTALSCIWGTWRGHRDMDEDRMLGALAGYGIVDGVKLSPSASVDGLELEAQKKIISELHKIWEKYCDIPL